MPEATPFRVLIVDDHPLMRRGISQLLQLVWGGDRFCTVKNLGKNAGKADE